MEATADSENDFRFISWSGLLGATVTVLMTTLDDSLWLVSFVGTSSLPKAARVVNAATFLSTLMGLAFLCCALAIILEQLFLASSSSSSSSSGIINEAADEHVLELRLQWIAVVFCWILAAFFYIKKQQLKRRRRRQQQEEASRLKDNGDDNGDAENKGSYGSMLPQPHEKEKSESSLPPETEDDTPQATSQPWTIVLLTTMGFLDEVSYFPALIVGHIFSVWELLAGTLLAGIAMLWIQAFLASQCKPFIDFLDDHVKLHGIIALFALILTIQLILEYLL